jgi:hypothetical protein
MDDMLRTLILLVTHCSVFAAGAGMALLHRRAVRDMDDGNQRAEATSDLAAQHRAAVAAGVGRHRARPVTALTAVQPAIYVAPTTLIGATLREAEVILATRRAQRVQERRAFVDVMTTLVGPARLRVHAIGRQYADVRSARSAA